MQIEKAQINDRSCFSKYPENFAFQLTLRFNKLKTKTTMNAKISVFVIYVETFICLLLYNLYDCKFAKPPKNNGSLKISSY